jgi:hypothetical protein
MHTYRFSYCLLLGAPDSETPSLKAGTTHILKQLPVGPSALNGKRTRKYVEDLLMTQASTALMN